MVGVEVCAHSIVHIRVREIASLMRSFSWLLHYTQCRHSYPFLLVALFFIRLPKGIPPSSYIAYGRVTHTSNMSNYFDLTEDISSDDSISVDGCPDPKRWRMSAASSTGAAAAAVSRHSNDSGGERGDDDDKWKLTKIYPLNELKKSKPIKCSYKDCDLVACSQWVSNGGMMSRNSCLDCQAT